MSTKALRRARMSLSRPPITLAIRTAEDPMRVIVSTRFGMSTGDLYSRTSRYSTW
jgi:hypothetical protein